MNREDEIAEQWGLGASSRGDALDSGATEVLVDGGDLEDIDWLVRVARSARDYLEHQWLDGSGRQDKLAELLENNPNK